MEFSLAREVPAAHWILDEEGGFELRHLVEEAEVLGGEEYANRVESPLKLSETPVFLAASQGTLEPGNAHILVTVDDPTIGECFQEFLAVEEAARILFLRRNVAENIVMVEGFIDPAHTHAAARLAGLRRAQKYQAFLLKKTRGELRRMIKAYPEQNVISLEVMKEVTKLGLGPVMDTFIRRQRSMMAQVYGRKITGSFDEAMSKVLQIETMTGAISGRRR